MSTIDQDVQVIRQGIYGKDVREAIADGIEKIGELAEDISGDYSSVTSRISTLENSTIKKTQQTLTTSEKEQARNNIGAQVTGSYVQYSSQSLNDAEKAQARSNISASSMADFNTILDKLDKSSVLGNAVSPIRGTISYDSTLHTITLSGVMFYPKSDLSWTTAITKTIDFSESSYPNNLKILLVDTDSKQVKVYSVEDDDGETKNNKAKWHPVCAVNGDKYLWTASIIPSIYYLDGNDIFENLKDFPASFVGVNAGIDMSYLYALTVTVTTTDVIVSKDHDFIIYGLYGDENKDLSIGTYTKNPDVVFPDDGVSIPISYNVAYLVADLLTHSVKLIDRTELNANGNKYVLIAYIYRDAHVVAFGETNILLNATSKNNLTASAYMANIAMRYISILGNAVVPIRGSINLDATNHTITLSDVMFYPKSNLGWTVRISAVVDFSDTSYPNNLKILLVNTENNDVKVYSSEDDDNLTLYCKGTWHPVCVVYAGKYLWTSSVIKDTYYVNGNDIYSTNDSSFRHDLYKEFQKVGVVGDSLSVGYSYNPATGETLQRNLKYSWPKYVMRDAGVPWLNLGQSGLTVLTWCSDSTYGKVQAEASGNKCQAYIIGLGENDQHNHTVPLGTPSDIVSDPDAGATTYYGGYARIINILKRVNPDCIVFCLTNPNPNENREEYNAAVRYIADTHFGSANNVFLVEMSAYTPEFRDVNSLIYKDGVNITSHYSPVGYKLIASIMEEAISHRMMTDINAFKLVGFIQYDTGNPTSNTMTE